MEDTYKFSQAFNNTLSLQPVDKNIYNAHKWNDNSTAIPEAAIFLVIVLAVYSK